MTYAALDVEFLIELWDKLAEKLTAQDKYELALEEFAHVRDNTKRIVRSEPWRRISGLHQLKQPRQLAIARELWLTRDLIASSADIAPGRILPDALIVHFSSDATSDVATFPELKRRHIRPYVDELLAAIDRGRAVGNELLPTLKPPHVGPPNAKSWQMRNPQAWARLEYCRAEVASLSEKLAIPTENLISPDSLRRILWEPPVTEDALVERLTALQVRPWQQKLLMPVISYALRHIPESPDA